MRYVSNAAVENYEIAETLPAGGLQENHRNWYIKAGFVETVGIVALGEELHAFNKVGCTYSHGFYNNTIFF